MKPVKRKFHQTIKSQNVSFCTFNLHDFDDPVFTNLKNVSMLLKASRLPHYGKVESQSSSAESSALESVLIA